MVEETKAKGGAATCPKSHSPQMLKSGFEHSLASSRVLEFSRLSVLALASCGGSNRKGEIAKKLKKRTLTFKG